MLGPARFTCEPGRAEHALLLGGQLQPEVEPQPSHR